MFINPHSKIPTGLSNSSTYRTNDDVRVSLGASFSAAVFPSEFHLLYEKKKLSIPTGLPVVRHSRPLTQLRALSNGGSNDSNFIKERLP
ncbi:hypothetical protein RB195_006566 [Necator americanus]|uniref:Uncharacterized protein n=1 Tax=Necator americanus TaxID=51031 RepID=A0ABR1BX07_NECAM